MIYKFIIKTILKYYFYFILTYNLFFIYQHTSFIYNLSVNLYILISINSYFIIKLFNKLVIWGIILIYMRYYFINLYDFLYYNLKLLISIKLYRLLVWFILVISWISLLNSSNYQYHIDRANQPPNYIFNFNIDIPIKYKSSITQRSNPTSPAKSPGKLTTKRYKLSSITPRPSGVSNNVVV